MQPLKLIAMDADDLAIVSAHVQDAVLKARDMAFEPPRRGREGDGSGGREGKFALALNRYVWEADPRVGGERRSVPARRRSWLHFERVRAARTLGVERAGEQVLSLLAITFAPKAEDDAAGTIELAFSGDAAVRLDVECVEARLTDTDATWAAAARPQHEDV